MKQLYTIIMPNNLKKKYEIMKYNLKCKKERVYLQ